MELFGVISDTIETGISGPRTKKKGKRNAQRKRKRKRKFQ
jgi:hypothetical protein